MSDDQGRIHQLYFARRLRHESTEAERQLWNDYEDHWSLKTVAGTDLARTAANNSERARTPELAGVN